MLGVVGHVVACRLSAGLCCACVEHVVCCTSMIEATSIGITAPLCMGVECAGGELPYQMQVLQCFPVTTLPHMLTVMAGPSAMMAGPPASNA